MEVNPDLIAPSHDVVSMLIDSRLMNARPDPANVHASHIDAKSSQGAASFRLEALPELL